jgi:hypothetical protein
LTGFEQKNEKHVQCPNQIVTASMTWYAVEKIVAFEWPIDGQHAPHHVLEACLLSPLAKLCNQLIEQCDFAGLP